MAFQIDPADFKKFEQKPTPWLDHSLPPRWVTIACLMLIAAGLISWIAFL